MKSRTLWTGCLVTFLVVLFFVGLSAVVLVLLGKGSLFASRERVGVVEIKGVLADSRTIIKQLDRYRDDSSIKAIVLRINSPGGAVGPAQEILREVEKIRQKKKIVASLGTVAASGGYYIASGADLIMANRGTATGSIGVIMQFMNLEGLYGKVGVGTETFKSGPHKDMGSPSRPTTPEERVIFQSMIDDIYNQFVEVVAKGRHKDVAEIRPLADGRVFTGRQAKELGLVDRLGDFHDAVLLAGELAGIPGEPTIMELGPKNVWRELFAGAGGNTIWGSGWPALPYQGEAANFFNLR